MKFPLPMGHKFGPNTTDLRIHDGRGGIADASSLTQFQHHLMLHWGGQTPSGVFDAGTQRLACEIQRVSGFPISGYLDEGTWLAAVGRGGVSDETAPETALRSTESDENPLGVPSPTIAPEEPVEVVVHELGQSNPKGGDTRVTPRVVGRPRKK